MISSLRKKIQEAETTISQCKSLICEIETQKTNEQTEIRLKQIFGQDLPRFIFEGTQLCLHIAGEWWKFPQFAEYHDHGNLFCIFVCRWNVNTRFAVNFGLGRNPIVCDDFVPPNDLLVFGQEMLIKYYKELPYVYDNSTIHTRSNPMK